MRPLILAKSVSSLPRPTFSPGFTRVPRCRTIMVPPGTSWPPKALKPRRWEFESRPFRELPSPFLCAIDGSLSLRLLQLLLFLRRSFLRRRFSCCRLLFRSRFGRLCLGRRDFLSRFLRAFGLLRLFLPADKLGRSELLSLESDLSDAHRRKRL